MGNKKWSGYIPGNTPGDVGRRKRIVAKKRLQKKLLRILGEVRLLWSLKDSVQAGLAVIETIQKARAELPIRRARIRVLEDEWWAEEFWVTYQIQMKDAPPNVCYNGACLIPVTERWDRHILMSLTEKTRENRAIRHALHKHGVTAFKFVRLAKYRNRLEARAAEMANIRQYGSHVSQGGFNMTWVG